MGRAAVKLAEREAETAKDVVKAHALPRDVRTYTIEPGEDHDGDLVMWVWFEVEDPNRRDHERVQRIRSFMGEVRDDLFKKLEEYRPHVGVR